MEEQESIIYGVRTGNTYHYIGKTRKSVVKENGDINKSDIHQLYIRKNLNKISVGNQEIKIDQLKSVDGEWYDEKLHEVVDKHKRKHPLQNAQWMLEGKRGYWEDKTRDPHTIQRLSESKFKKIVEYDANGNLIKIWGSGKEVAIKVFNDYMVNDDGTSCKTALYHLLRTEQLKRRFRHGSYWFKESELRERFNCVPKRLYVEKIIEDQKRQKAEKRALIERKPITYSYKTKYSIIHYNPDMTIKATYSCLEEAAYMLKLTKGAVKYYLYNPKPNQNYILRHGEKHQQPVRPVYPEYEKQPIRKAVHQRIQTRTRTTIDWYIGGKFFRSFDSVLEAADHFEVSTQIIRRAAIGKTTSFKYNLKYGNKKQIEL